MAKVGKTTIRHFFGFKFHLIINDKGEIRNFVITQRNVDDRELLKNERFIESIKGKLYRLGSSQRRYADCRLLQQRPPQ